MNQKGPLANAFKDLICLELLYYKEPTLGGNRQLLIGQDVNSGYSIFILSQTKHYHC